MGINREGKNAREFFRIFYRRDNPVLEIDKKKFIIIDISEGGIKFSPLRGSIFFEDSIVEGLVVFGKRGSVKVKGTVIRVTKTDIAIKLEDASRIPLARIMEEQRFLIQRGQL